MTPAPVVSVIIPAYGHAEYIVRTLESVFAQTFRDFEVIVVNDGSPDNTEQVLAPLIAAGRIRYHAIPNGGVAAARNFGISKATGQYIALLDDDDLWPPDKLEWQVETLRKSDALAIGGSAHVFTSDCEPMEHVSEGDVVELDLKRIFGGNPFISPGQVLFSRSAYERGLRFDTSLWGADDMDFWIQLAQNGRFLRAERTALFYRVHSSNASHNRLKLLVNGVRLLKKHGKLLEPPQREECMETGYRWLYEYLGKQLLREAKQTLRSKPPRIFHTGRIVFTLIKTFAGSYREAPNAYLEIKRDFMSSFIRTSNTR